MVDYHCRMKWLQDVMDDQKIDLIVYGSSPDVQYLTGSNVDWRRSRDLRHPEDCLFVPKEGDPILMNGVYSAWRAESSWVPDIRNLGLLQDFHPEVTKAIDDLVDNPKRVAIGEYTWSSLTLTVQSHLRGATFFNADGLLDNLRMIKDSDEVELMKKTAELTDEVMEKIVDELEPGITMRELALKLEHEGRLRGARDISFLPSGTMYKSESQPSSKQTNYDPNQGLSENTSIAFDVGYVFNGYCSDWGRSFYYGRPEQHIKDAYTHLMAAVVDVSDAIGSEVQRTDEVYPFIEKQIEKAGYGEFLKARHPLRDVGHQIGVEVHETPWLRPEDKMEFQDGMVFCIEPKLWHNGEYNIRVEDTVMIRNGKAEALTNYDRERFQL